MSAEGLAIQLAESFGPIEPSLEIASEEASADTTLLPKKYSRQELDNMTVSNLRDILKARKVTPLSKELLDKIVD